jgi:hypothetical protein
LVSKSTTLSWWINDRTFLGKFSGIHPYVNAQMAVGHNRVKETFSASSRISAPSIQPTFAPLGSHSVEEYSEGFFRQPHNWGGSGVLPVFESTRYAWPEVNADLKSSQKRSVASSPVWCSD